LDRGGYNDGPEQVGRGLVCVALETLRPHWWDKGGAGIWRRRRSNPGEVGADAATEPTPIPATQIN